MQEDKHESYNQKYYIIMMIYSTITIAYANNIIILDKLLENSNVDLIKVLKKRKTERSYTNQVISLQRLSTLLWAR